MKDTLRRVMSSSGIVFVLIFFHLVGMALLHVFGRYLSVSKTDFLMIRGGFVLVCCALLGVSRVWESFPLSDMAYFKWLQTTPWQSGTPFPFGYAKMYLNWADAISPALFLIFEWSNPYCRVHWMLAAYLAGYQAYHIFIFHWSEERFLNYCLGIGFGLAVLLLGRFHWVLVVLVGMYVIAVCGQRRVLGRFPWLNGPKPEDYSRGGPVVFRDGEDIGGRHPASRQLYMVRSMFEALAPTRPVERSIAHAMAVSTMVGWWIFVLVESVAKMAPQASLSKSEQFEVSAMLFSMFVFLGFWARVSFVLGTARAPLSVPGRLLTGKLIIPKYDVALVAPTLSAVIGTAVFLATSWLGWYAPICGALGATIILFGFIAGKPSPIKWWLTGQYHLRLKRSRGTRA